jgi:hypothetical protein
MELEVTGDVWHWKGPAPHHFVTVPEEDCGALEALAPAVSYGWGMIPVAVRLRGTSWTTSLFPKDGGYVVPLKAEVRRREGVEVGDTVTLLLTVES